MATLPRSLDHALVRLLREPVRLAADGCWRHSDGAIGIWRSATVRALVEAGLAIAGPDPVGFGTMVALTPRGAVRAREARRRIVAAYAAFVWAQNSAAARALRQEDRP